MIGQFTLRGAVHKKITFLTDMSVKGGLRKCKIQLWGKISEIAVLKKLVFVQQTYIFAL